MGFIIPGIIFIGSAIIKSIGAIANDAALLAAVWNLYVIWTFVSIGVIAIPLIVAYVKFKPSFREFFFFEAGGILFFSPIWFAFLTEVTGDSIIAVLRDGVENGIAFPGPDGGLIGTNIGPIFLIPILIVGMVVGLFLLRPSFIERVPITSAPPELEALKKTPDEEIEDEMPDVTPPVADSASITQLRKLLTDLSVPITIIEALINAGYATVTDLISTSPESLAKEAGIDVKMAQDIHLSVQKKVWFGGIE